MNFLIVLIILGAVIGGVMGQKALMGLIILFCGSVVIYIGCISPAIIIDCFIVVKGFWKKFFTIPVVVIICLSVMAMAGWCIAPYMP